MAAERTERELIVDRFEGDYVVLEVDGAGTVDLPRWMLPPRLAEGDLLRARIGESDGVWRIELEPDPAASRARLEEVERTVERLSRRDPGGDIKL